MFAKDIVHFDITAIKPTTTIKEALSLFCQHKVSELAVVNDQNECLGILDEVSISHILTDIANTTIENIELHKTFVHSNQHVYEVFELLTSHSLSLVPIVNSQNQFIGVITTASIINYISNFTGFMQKGAVIIIDLSKKDYSLSQICQIIESNSAKIISLFTNETTNDTIEVTIKLNIEDITSIMQSFDRYNYKTKTLHAQTEMLDGFLQSRIDNLMSYLNV